MSENYVLTMTPAERPSDRRPQLENKHARVKKMGDKQTQNPFLYHLSVNTDRSHGGETSGGSAMFAVQ